MKIYPKAVLSLLIILLNLSCSKDDSSPTEKERPVDVYVVGKEYISQTTSYAKIWKNGEGTPLTDGKQTAGLAGISVEYQ